MLRREFTAEASFADIRERSKFGMAMAAIIRMIATTIKSSIREKPFWFFMIAIGGLKFIVPDIYRHMHIGSHISSRELAHRINS